jgi:hypothetical protein
MSTSNPNIKLLCDEYNSSSNDEQILRILNRILSNVKGGSEKSQKETFISLTEKGVYKLLNAFKDNNLDIRRTSCKVILEMLNNNEVLQNIFCEKFNFNPIGNIICLNWLPKGLKENIKIDERFINEIKNSNYNYGKPLKYWMWPENNKYSDDAIPDPQKYLVGFYYANKNVKFYNLCNKLIFLESFYYEFRR